MLKVLRKISSFNFIFFFSFLLMAGTASAVVPEEYWRGNEIGESSVEPFGDWQDSSYDYVLNSYDIHMIVNEDNTMEITETIGAYFNVNKHGIFRKIPLKNEVVRLDGTKTRNHAKVKKIKVDNDYSTSVENSYKVIKIGNANYTVTGQQTYTISYVYDLGKDLSKDYDELYFNLIGSEWDTIISNVTFTIEMPKDFDTEKLGFSSGGRGSTDSSKIDFTVNDNQVVGVLNGRLRPGQALTVRVELPEGYFVKNNAFEVFMMFISCGLPILFVFIAFSLWSKYGKDDEVIETVEFYPPEGLNSLDVGFLYKGKADNEDVTSLLVYLANKGYLKIIENESKGLFSSKSKAFKIVKIKDYDGNNIDEKVFFDGLFKLSKDGNEVTYSDLYDRFYMTTSRVLANANKKKHKEEIFEKSASSKAIYIWLMIILSFVLITIPPVCTYGDTESMFFALLFPGFGFSVLFKLLLGGKETIYVNGKATSSLIITKLFGLVWGGMFGGIPWAIMVLPSLLYDKMYLIIYVIGLACIFGLILCLTYLPKRTPYGNEMLGKIRGFKNFLEAAEKEKLETMVMQDPNYFFDILPYTYVLGVSDKWIKKFEAISLQAPDWYYSSGGFDVNTFGTFMNNTMSSAQTAMTSSPSSSGSGGSSGGGFSGGGSGGGGGGSW